MEIEFNKEDYNWTSEPVIGMSLLMIGGEIDSFGDKIQGVLFYNVGKHKTSGKVAIIPTKRNLKHEFTNEVMKKRNLFN